MITEEALLPLIPPRTCSPLPTRTTRIKTKGKSQTQTQTNCVLMHAWNCWGLRHFYVFTACEHSFASDVASFIDFSPPTLLLSPFLLYHGIIFVRESWSALSVALRLPTLSFARLKRTFQWESIKLLKIPSRRHYPSLGEITV